MSWVEDLALLRDWYTNEEMAEVLEVGASTPEKWGAGSVPRSPQRRRIMFEAARVRRTLETAPPLEPPVAESRSAGRKPERGPAAGPPSTAASQVGQEEGEEGGEVAVPGGRVW